MCSRQTWFSTRHYIICRSVIPWCCYTAVSVWGNASIILSINQWSRVFILHPTHGEHRVESNRRSIDPRSQIPDRSGIDWGLGIVFVFLSEDWIDLELHIHVIVIVEGGRLSSDTNRNLLTYPYFYPSIHATAIESTAGHNRNSDDDKSSFPRPFLLYRYGDSYIWKWCNSGKVTQWGRCFDYGF